MDIKINSNAKELAEELEDNVKAYKKQLKFQVFRAMTLLEAEVKQQIRSKAGLHVRTGALLNSVTSSVSESLDGLITGEVKSSGVKYAATHEFGATIVPKNKQFLAIPIGDNRRSDGMPKVTTKDLMAMGKGKSFIRKGIIFMKEDGGGIKAMFALRKSVVIPARPFFSTALAAKKDTILREFGLFLSMSFGTK